MNSVWALGRSEVEPFPTLMGTHDVEVVIVGGGITGLATAKILSDSGSRVAVVEAWRLGSGVTGNSTGNLYSTLSQGLSPLAEKWDEEVVRRVVDRRRKGLATIQHNVESLGIQCDFARRPLYMGVGQGGRNQIAMLEEEFRLARAAGLQCQLLDVGAGMPLPMSSVLRIDDQAQFHPLQYCDGLARALVHGGVSLYENSAVIDIDAAAGAVRTSHGELRGNYIVLATHTPKGINMVQAEMEPYREHGLSARLQNEFAAPGIYWMLDDSVSLRSMRSGEQDYLVVVGGKYKTGKIDPDRAYWQELEDYGNRYFATDGPSHRWSAQQYQAADLLPYIGPSGHDNVFVATGYAADGLVWSEVAAEVICHQILGRTDRDAALFSPRRFTPAKSAKGWLEANTKVAKHLSTDRFSTEKADDLSQIVPGEGRVLKVQGEYYAAYRSAAGELSVLSPVCPHMKCIVHWNPDDRSWDCPCHGSRFDVSGAVLEGPALEGLAQRQPPARQ